MGAFRLASRPGSAVPGSAAPQCGEDEERRSGERRSQEHSQGRSPGWYSRGYLPHFDSAEVIQHITYRLADALPEAVLERMQAEVRAAVPDEDKRESELRQQIEDYLDSGHGSCVLREPEVAACVVDTWHHFDGDRYRLLEWVVMPNHCHVLIEPLEGAALGKIVLSWKNFTARFINDYTRRTGVRRSQARSQARSQGSQVWQRDYWDRFIRDEHHFAAARHYIVMNPVKARLVAAPGDWPWSSAGERGWSDAKG